MLIRTPRQDRRCGARAERPPRWRPRDACRSAWRARRGGSPAPPPRGRGAPRRRRPRPGGGLGTRAARRGGLVGREARLLRLAPGALLGLAALLLLGL